MVLLFFRMNTFGDFLTFFVVLLVATVVVTFVYMGYMSRRRAKEFEERLQTIPDFTPTLRVKDYEMYYAVYFDDTHEKMVVFQGDDTFVCGYKDLLGVEVQDNVRTYTAYSTLKGMGRAFVGSMVAGRIGGIVGAMTTPGHQEKEVSKVQVWVFVQSETAPLQIIHCLDSMKSYTGTKKSLKGMQASVAYDSAMLRAMAIAKKIGAIVEKNPCKVDIQALLK